MRHTAHTRKNTETGTLLTLTLACYVIATACVLTVGYTLTTLAARDFGRQAAAAVGCLPGSGILTANAIYGSIDGAGLEEMAMRAVEAALLRDGVNWYVLLYPLPGLAFPVGRIGGFQWAVLGSGVGLSAGMLLAALRVLGMRAGEWGRLREVGETPAALGGRA